MTPAEQRQLEEKAAARAAVVARMNDPTVTLTDDDARHMSGSEIRDWVNAGRFGPEVGRDKRLRRAG